MQQTIYIDDVQPCEEITQGIDVFEIEWFETQKHLFHRLTTNGVELHLLKEDNREWSQGDKLYSEGVLIAQLAIKPTQTIQFISDKAEEVADFSFYIGNRHLPVFIEKDNTFLVPYDGNLYEQLVAKFTTRIVLVKKQLLAKNLLKKKR